MTQKTRLISNVNFRITMKKYTHTFILVLLLTLVNACQTENETASRVSITSENLVFTEFLNGYIDGNIKTSEKNDLYTNAGKYVYKLKKDVSQESLEKIAKNLYFVLGHYEPSTKESILLNKEEEALLLKLMDYLKRKY